jgi:hypothetical protein
MAKKLKVKSVPRLSGAPSCAPVGAQAQAEGSKESKKSEKFSTSRRRYMKIEGDKRRYI